MMLVGVSILDREPPAWGIDSRPSQRSRSLLADALASLDNMRRPEALNTLENFLNRT